MQLIFHYDVALIFNKVHTFVLEITFILAYSIFCLFLLGFPRVTFLSFYLILFSEVILLNVFLICTQDSAGSHCERSHP